MVEELIRLGKWTPEAIGRLLSEAPGLDLPGERIRFISEKFLGTPYKESSLIGSSLEPEKLVIDLEGVDCFTLIDYVEVMRISPSFAGFKESILRVRYRSGTVAFDHRNHFFTDWISSNPGLVRDVTEEIGGPKTVPVEKRLNVRSDGTLFLPGIEPVRRVFHYIPEAGLDRTVLAGITTGDYAGIVSLEDGLDVSHVGIVVAGPEGLFLRHASSREAVRKVVDEPLAPYLTDKPGIILLRPLPL